MSDISKDIETPIESAESKPPGKLSDIGRAAIKGNPTDTKNEWRDLGIVDVPVADLPMPENVSDPADFDHHISHVDAIQASHQLPDIQKQVNAGKTGDDFWADDQAAGLDYVNGKQRLYDLYYGSDPVRLDKVGDHYDIISGRHRIFAAKELGLVTIPAYVREKA